MASTIESRSRPIDRRRFLRLAAGVVALTGLGTGLVRSNLTPEPETSTRLLVPREFTPKIIARSGQRLMAESYYRWHAAPDGGGCFASNDGGWIYVSNGERTPGGTVGAVRFDARGRLVDGYGILSGSRHNCAGCVTPWNTWLSCEEHSRGIVWECDPFGQIKARARPGLGVFKHESASVDPDNLKIYLTEDRHDGCLYRFTPANTALSAVPDLDHGSLEVATLQQDRIKWIEIPDRMATETPLRFQVGGVARFNGGGGYRHLQGFVAVYHQGRQSHLADKPGEWPARDLA